jgi:hypothetical protein
MDSRTHKAILERTRADAVERPSVTDSAWTQRLAAAGTTRLAVPSAILQLSITFTGGVQIGKSIASKMGYRRAVLELGGNDPIIVMEDADLEEASALAVSGSYEDLFAAVGLSRALTNSVQHCNH